MVIKEEDIKNLLILDDDDKYEIIKISDDPTKNKTIDKK